MTSNTPITGTGRAVLNLLLAALLLILVGGLAGLAMPGMDHSAHQYQSKDSDHG